jgi:hypothetical protein
MIDALAEPLLQEGEQVVDAKRFNTGFVRTRQHEPRFAFGEPPSRTITADRTLCDGDLSTLATSATKLSHVEFAP